MAAPLYFFPRKQLADVVDAQADRFRPSILRECGLEETFADVASVRGQTSTNELTGHGPGGASGVITTLLPASGRCPLRIGFHPDFQSWQPAVSEMLWIGTDKEHPPKPEDLLRSGAVLIDEGQILPPHAGLSLELGDGHRWTVPIVRRPAIAAEAGHAVTSLPMDLGWDESGRFAETIKPKYLALWNDAAEICDFYFAAAEQPRKRLELPVEKALTWALRILGLNYRYGRHEQNLLRAVDKTNIFTLLGLAVDAPLVYRLLGSLKKSVPATPPVVNTSPGSTDGSQVTDPAAAS